MQFAMELVMVANPSVSWLAAAIAISVPSIVVESVEQLHSLGVRADTLYTFLVRGQCACQEHACIETSDEFTPAA